MPHITSHSPSGGEDDEIMPLGACFDGTRGESGARNSDQLSLNDNINYRMCYERGDGAGVKCYEKETSLHKVACSDRCSQSLRGKSSLLGGAAGQRGTGYLRFSDRQLPADETGGCFCLWAGVRAGAVACALLLAAGAAVWWCATSALGSAWSEEHYRRLWERAHAVSGPHHTSELAPYFHDHNNLSTKNRQNWTESGRKKLRDGAASASAGDDACGNVRRELRFDCYPQDGATEQECRKRGCCWQPQRSEGNATEAGGGGVPYCFYPPRFGTYRLLNLTESERGLVAYYQLLRASPYQGDFRIVLLQVSYLSDDALHIKITDAEHERWEPPVPALPVRTGTGAPRYRVLLQPRGAGWRVLRVADNTTILDTRDVGALILSDRVLQLSALLPTHTLYGLGERRGALKIDTDFATYTIFNHDQAPIENSNLYGSHPFYLALESSGNSHGVLMLNSDAMDVVVQPAPAVTWRATGGVLQLLVVLGPSPRDVISQYTALVGRPAMPPYWALGFHLCKYNYGSLQATREVWKRNRDAGIPFDVQWNDLDYMKEGNDFTVDPVSYAGLAQFVEELHQAGMHYVPLIDPGVSAAEPRGSYPPYDLGLHMNVFIRNSSDQPFVGKVWNRVSTVWPDFTHPNSTEYWRRMLGSLHEQVPFDGAWIDMNEPSNFVSGALVGGCAADAPPYTPRVAGGALHYRTLCMDARHYAGPHAHLHNLHAYTQALATHSALSDIRGKRPFIITRASSPGVGRLAGHWSGDVASEWHDMRASIPELLSFSLFGVPLMGADICGFRGNTSRELCQRWMQLGAFYPFARNHNSESSTPQDPAFLGAAVVAASREALRLRYALLPHLYTLFWRAHISGHTVATPLFFHFPLDNTTHALERQFLLGSSVLVAPVLDPGTTTVRVYLPRQLWYSLNGTRLVPFVGWGVLHDNQTVLVKGGSVLVLQPPAARGPVNTRDARGRALQLLVAPCDMQRAHGELYWDDGDSIDSWQEKKYSLVELRHGAGWVRGEARWWGWGVPAVERVLVMNQDCPRAVSLHNRSVSWRYDAASRLLTVHSLHLTLDKPFRLSWQ